MALTLIRPISLYYVSSFLDGTLTILSLLLKNGFNESRVWLSPRKLLYGSLLFVLLWLFGSGFIMVVVIVYDNLSEFS
jgi:hypothetical protein